VGADAHGHRLKASRLAFSAEDQQLIETRQFTVRDVANFIGVPPHKLGDTGRTAYASLEQENQSYLDDALDYWLCVWEAQCWDKLLTEEEKAADSHVVEFLRLALMRADMATRANYYRTALGGRGWMTPNEVRGRENLNPSDSADADEILTPLNMGQGGDQNDPSPEPAQPQEPDDSTEPEDDGTGEDE
jgi:HK97 family phage portal protein